MEHFWTYIHFSGFGPLRVPYLGVETTYWDNLKTENASHDPGMNMKYEKKKKIQFWEHFWLFLGVFLPYLEPILGRSDQKWIF